MGVAEARAKSVLGLDGVRGLLALYVVVHHCWLLSFPGYPANTGPAWTGWLTYGRFAVVAFIVLSGFSLGLAPAARGWRLDSLRGYTVRRAWRILPPYWAALVLSWVIIPPTASSVWVYGLLLQDVFDEPSPNGALWSIAVEAMLYLAFPALVWLRRRIGAVATLAISLIPLVVLGPATGTGYARELAPLFTLGMLAAGVRSHRIRWDWLALAAVTPVLVLVFARGSVWAAANFWWLDLALGPAIALTLIAVAHQRPGWALTTLDSPPLRSLGGFSYSLYLIHMPLVAAVSHVVPGFLATVAVAVPLCLLVAHAFAAVFERMRPGP